MKVSLGKSDQNNLWNDIRNGNAEAFNRLYDQYVDILFPFGLSITNDAEHIKDSINDLFFGLYKYSRNLSDTVYNEKVQDPMPFVRPGQIILLKLIFLKTSIYISI